MSGSAEGVELCDTLDKSSGSVTEESWSVSLLHVCTCIIIIMLLYQQA